MLERMEFGGSGSSSQWEEVEAVSQTPTGTSFTIGQSLTVGNIYHIFSTNAGSTAANAKNLSALTAGSGVGNFVHIEDIVGKADSSYFSAIAHYSFTATAATVSFSKSSSRQPGYILYDTQRSGSGGGETVLWTNADPSAAFSAQDVTLSSSYTNFRRLKFYFRPLSTMSTENSVEFSADEISKWYINGTTVATGDVEGVMAAYNSTWYVRRICRTSLSNTLYISLAGKVNGSGTGTTTIVPTKITGIN